MYSVHVLPSFHYDVVYLKDYPSYLKQSFEILDKATAMLERHPEYTFTVEQIILVEAYCEGRPDRLATLRSLAATGRMHFAPGMYVMPDMNMPDGESMFLQTAAGFKWLKEQLSYKPEVCWIADCWGHHAQLPQILTQCGFTHYAFWRCMAPELARNHFLWRGLDGTDLKTHWLSKGYGSIRFPDDAEIVNAPDLELSGCSPEQLKKLCADFAALGSKGVTLLCDGGDFLLPQDSAPAALAALRDSGEFKDISFSHPARYMAALDWSDAPIHQGEFNSAFQGCFSSNITIKQLTRECAFLFNSLERLSALSGAALPNRDQLLKGILKQQFHDTLCGTIADAPLKDTIRELKASRAALQPRGKRLFNPTQFGRVEILKDAKGLLKITLPPHGGAAKRSATRLEGGAGSLPERFANAHYAAELGADGFIKSLKANGEELVKAGAEQPFGALTLQLDYGDLWLHFDSPLNGGCKESALTHNVPDPLTRPDAKGLVNRSSFGPTITKAAVAFQSPELLVVRQEGTLCFWRLTVKFSTETTFRSDSPRIDFKTELLPMGRHFRVRAAFPTNIGPEGEVCHEIPFGVQPRSRALHAAQNWMDFSDAAHGLAVLNRGLPANAVDADGNMLLTLFRSAAMEYKAPSAASFGEGKRHNLEYAVMPHGVRDFAAIIKQGLLLNFPLLPTRHDLDGAEAFTVDAPNVFVSALRQSDGGVFARLYEGAGQAANANLSLPPHLRAYAFTDGLERPAGEFKTCGGKLALGFRPFEIKGILFKEG